MRGSAGPFAIQAAIAAEHCRAARAEDTDWNEIVRLYDGSANPLGRAFTKAQLRTMFEEAGLRVEEVELQAKRRDFTAWCDRTGCTGPEREKTRELLGNRVDEQGGYTDTKILIRARKR